MNNQNGLMAKSDRLNITALIGSFLAVIGAFFSQLSASYMGVSMSGLTYDISVIGTLIPALLMLGVAVLFVLQMDKLGAVASFAAYVVYAIAVCAMKAWLSNQGYGGVDFGISVGFTFYLATFGVILCMASIYINQIIFKNVKISLFGGASKAPKAPKAPQAPYGQAPTQQYAQAPTQQYAQTPTQQYAQAPTQQYAQAPTQQYAQAPTQPVQPAPAQQYAQAPTQQYGQAPTQQYAQAPTQPVQPAPAQQAQTPVQPVQPQMPNQPQNNNPNAQ